MTRFILILAIIFLAPRFADASTAPTHLTSWAKQLYDISMPAVKLLSQDSEIIHIEGNRIILGRAEPLLELSDIESWADDPVIVQKLEETWEMETQFSMELAPDAFLRINWVEDHLNLVVEQEGSDGFTFMLLGVVSIEEQDDGSSLLTISPHVDRAHYQFHNGKTQEKYFPGLIVDP